MMTMSSLGSEYQEVPKPPSQPYRPGTAAMSSRLVTTETPNPQPRPSKNPEIRLDAAFCSGVNWSVVISSTESLDKMRSPPCLPWETTTCPRPGSRRWSKPALQLLTGRPEDGSIGSP